MKLTIQKPLTHSFSFSVIQNSVMLFCNPLHRFLTFFCGGVGLVIVAILARRWWRERERRLVQQTDRRRRGTFRKKRQNVQRAQPSESQQCVVCCENQREIILLPCGHVCLCENCSERIEDYCPVCRTAIETKATAYIP
jgi:E3 ubiquitin-protein ligase MUL1